MIQASSFSIAIYLIALVVFAIFKAISDKAKKSETPSGHQPDVPQRKKEAHDLPEPWKDLFPKEIIEATRPKPVVKKATYTKMERKPLKVEKMTPKVFIEDASEEGKRTVSEINTPQNNTTEINEEDYAFHNIEEVRKAIIWSEIINPKYN
jgi:hypothetical protein